MPRQTFPPGPKGSGLLGISPLRNARPLEMFTGWARQYGDVASWRTFHYRIYLLNHPDDIETVLATRSRNFIKGRGMQANLVRFGKLCLASEGSFWLRQV